MNLWGRAAAPPGVTGPWVPWVGNPNGPKGWGQPVLRSPCPCPFPATLTLLPFPLTVSLSPHLCSYCL